MLDQLPDELLVTILSNYVGSQRLQDTLSVLSCVCQAWNQTFDRIDFWRLLGKKQNIIIRSRCRNPKQFFWRRRQQLQRATKDEADRILLQWKQRLVKKDCAVFLRKQLATALDATLRHTILHRAVPSDEHRTLLHTAAWHGRYGVTRLLLQDYHMSPWVQDSNHATPLLIAAWAGHERVVSILLQWIIEQDIQSREQRMAHLQQKGIPPQSSSCGGKGPKSALEWARRKGFTRIVRQLETALRELKQDMEL